MVFLLLIYSGNTSPHSSPLKKKAYSLDSAKKMLIAADEENKKVWAEILAELSDPQVSEEWSIVFNEL